jgi:hypothetical protein
MLRVCSQQGGGTQSESDSGAILSEKLKENEAMVICLFISSVYDWLNKEEINKPFFAGTFVETLLNSYPGKAANNFFSF